MNEENHRQDFNASRKMATLLLFLDGPRVKIMPADLRLYLRRVKHRSREKARLQHRYRTTTLQQCCELYLEFVVGTLMQIIWDRYKFNVNGA